MSPELQAAWTDYERRFGFLPPPSLVRSLTSGQLLETLLESLRTGEDLGDELGETPPPGIEHVNY